MKRNNTSKTVYALSFLFLSSLFSCELITPEVKDPNVVDESLHLSFKTPDWERKIDCTHLDLNSYNLNSEANYTSATSASTRNSFFLSFPKDSSKMVIPSNLQKYAIKEFGDNDAPFQFSFKVPVQEGSGTYLLSQEGFSAQEFNEITEIKYAGTSGNFAVFQIKGKYQMSMLELNNSGIKKAVSGTYHFKVKANRK